MKHSPQQEGKLIEFMLIFFFLRHDAFPIDDDANNDDEEEMAHFGFLTISRYKYRDIKKTRMEWKLETSNNNKMSIIFSFVGGCGKYPF